MSVRASRRRLPVMPEPKAIGPISLTLGVLAVTVFLTWWGGFPAFVAFGGFIVIVCVAGVCERRRLRQIARDRNGESICTFARSFDCRALDTRIIRAVYEEFQTYTLSLPDFPFRASDSIKSDLRIEGEDVDDIGRDIARRLECSMEGAERNPYYGCVETLGDVVEFFRHQCAALSGEARKERCDL
jgi:hypothetical protein